MTISFPDAYATKDPSESELWLTGSILHYAWETLKQFSWSLQPREVKQVFTFIEEGVEGKEKQYSRGNKGRDK